MTFARCGRRNNNSRVPCKRWLMLVLYASIAMTNFGMWLTYASTPSDHPFNGANAYLIDLLAVIVGFGYLIGAPVAGWMLQNHGLRLGMVVASVLNAAAGVLRWLGSLSGEYWPILLGQLLIGIAQPFFMSSAVQLSMDWFPPRERATATSLGILSQARSRLNRLQRTCLHPPHF